MHQTEYVLYEDAQPVLSSASRDEVATMQAHRSMLARDQGRVVKYRVVRRDVDHDAENVGLDGSTIRGRVIETDVTAGEPAKGE